MSNQQEPLEDQLHSFHQSLSAVLASSPVDNTASQLMERSNTQDADVDHVDVEEYGISTGTVFRNPPVAVLYEQALKNEAGSSITSTGALVVRSGAKTGRSPKDKRIVDEPSTNEDVWWGPVNIKLSEHSFLVNRERAIDYLNTQNTLYVFDGFAGWDPDYRIKIRVITSRAYHCLFMNNMLIRPTKEELLHFGEPDYVIYNAGCFPANRFTEGMTSATSVALHFGRREMVILGTQYAGEMKKGVLTIMMYLMLKLDVLPMHASANEDPRTGKVSVFFGLSGTGKTTLSADPRRSLIGDDEHVWTDRGVFNVEGGCYAKCIDLSHESEPEIFDAVRFGAVVENAVFSEHDRVIDYHDISITENTRTAYPLEYIPNCKIPAVAGHPEHVIMLTCDAFGVLPPVSKLSSAQAMYHFISGYTAKVAGTEVGITEPQAVFSSCFGEPFLVWHPAQYAQKLAERLATYNADAWLINTGWVSGSYGQGRRCPLKYTRAIIDAIHDGALAEDKVEYEEQEIFGLRIPKEVPGVPRELLNPINAWADTQAYKTTARKLAALFIDNFKKYQDKADAEVVACNPSLD